MILRRPDCAATKTFQSVQRPLKLGVQAAEHVCKLDFRESGSRRFYGRIHRGEGRLRFLLYGYHQSFAILSVHEGNVLRWNYIQNELTNVTKEAGLPRLTMHALRHTFATRCIEAGMRPKTLQVLLGHSSVDFTMNLYVHVTPEQKEKEVLRVEKNILCGAGEYYGT